MTKILDNENSSDFNEFPNDYFSDDNVYFKYATITSVDLTISMNKKIAFSFQIVKNIFSLNSTEKARNIF
jgi:hypothetical protein